MTRVFLTILSFVLFVSACSQNRTTTNTPSPTVTRPSAITVSGAPNTIPAGTTLEVRTNEAIVSTNAEGRTYQGEIATEVVDADKKAHIRPITLKTTQDNDVSVGPELKPGEVVVVEGTDKVQDGARVDLQTPGAPTSPGAPGVPAGQSNGSGPKGSGAGGGGGGRGGRGKRSGQ